VRRGSLDVSDNPATVRHMTPDYMPVLSAGAHDNPQDGACVMEYVSLLAGETWSDRPACTHPVLAKMAQTVNDLLPDETRHTLVPMINRLFNTAPSGTSVEQCLLTSQLADWCATETQNSTAALCAAKSRRATSPEIAVRRAEDAVHCAAYTGNHLKPVKLLLGLLDEYDRLTGRVMSPELSPTSLRTLSAAVG